MLSNLLGFDIEAEIMCARARYWIWKEERKVSRMKKHNYTKDDEECTVENESDTQDTSVNVLEIFQNAIESKAKRKI